MAVRLRVGGNRLPVMPHRRPHPHSSPMSLPETPSAPTENSDFQDIFVEAVKQYNKKTNGNITSNPLLVELGSCTSVDDILTVFHRRDEDLSGHPGVA
jgi:hypothetical protein